jgi:hypothetical protein
MRTRRSAHTCLATEAPTDVHDMSDRNRVTAIRPTSWNERCVMEPSDELYGSTMGGAEVADTESESESESDRMARSLPRSLAVLLARLAYLTPEAQAVVLDTVGPGSRLVLEALKLVERGQPGLTEMGRGLSERFANDASVEARPAAGVVPMGSRIRRIARVVSTHDLGVAAAATTGPETAVDAGHLFEYNLMPEQDEPFLEASAVVGVARMGRKLRVWQVPGRGSDTVIVLDSMERLPTNGEDPLVLRNPEDEPPSRLLRRTLGLSDENDA